mmetsp:Transcript_10629/g.28218  ORF Transcript_10629/g.28218 Transcript_10629/m.28218 type:complete len:108 (-) Transcript_10629:447-770(-)
MGMYYYFLGWLLCMTIVGIPLGRQLFKMGRLSMVPFGMHTSYGQMSPLQVIANILWSVLFGWELFLASLVSAVFLACTIVGIPFALQHLKLMRVCLAPFGLAVTKPK